MESRNSYILTDDEIDRFANYNLDRESLKDILHKAVITEETDVLIEAMTANYELEQDVVEELLGEDVFDVEDIDNQSDHKQETCV